MNVVPKNGQVLLRPDASIAVTKGGIIVPEKYRKRSVQGTVVAYGPDTSAVEVGDHVIWGIFKKGREVYLDGVQHMFIDEEDLLAITEED